MRNYITKVDNTAPAATGYLYADEDNVRFAELTNAVDTAGITLDEVDAPDTDLKMLAQAIARYMSGGIFAQDGGTANAYVLSLTGTYVAPKAYFTGLRVLFYPANSSTGASVVNAFGLGIKSIYRPDGSAIQSGDIFANRLVDAYYDESLNSGAGAFRLAPWAIPPSILSALAVPLSGEGIAVDGSYHVALNFPNLIAGNPDLTDLFAYYSQTLGHHYSLTLAQLIAAIQGGLASVSLVSIAAVLKIEERRGNGVLHQVAANTWVKRPLSDVLVNQISGASLASNQITLPAGIYRANWVGSSSMSVNHRCRLFDVTRQLVLGTGTAANAYIGDTAATPIVPSIGSARFEIPAGSPHTIEMQSWMFPGKNGLFPDQGAVAPFFGDWTTTDIGSGNYHVDGWISITKES